MWGPSLFYDNSMKRLWLFFAVSVPENRKSATKSYPGGEIYQTYTDDIIEF